MGSGYVVFVQDSAECHVYTLDHMFAHGLQSGLRSESGNERDTLSFSAGFDLSYFCRRAFAETLGRMLEINERFGGSC